MTFIIQRPAQTWPSGARLFQIARNRPLPAVSNPDLEFPLRHSAKRLMWVFSKNTEPKLKPPTRPEATTGWACGSCIGWKSPLEQERQEGRTQKPEMNLPPPYIPYWFSPSWDPMDRSFLTPGLSVPTCQVEESEKMTSRALLPSCSPQPSPHTQGAGTGNSSSHTNRRVIFVPEDPAC